MSNDIRQRAQTVIIDRLDKSFDRIKEDLEEVGLEMSAILDVAKSEIAIHLDAHYDIDPEQQEKKQPVLLTIGEDGAKAPLCIAKSMHLGQLVALFKDLHKLFKKMEQEEDDKVNSWMMRTCGRDDGGISFDYSTLQVVEKISRSLVVTLAQTQQVLDLDENRITNLVKGWEGKELEGLEALSRDVCKVRQAGPKYTIFLKELLTMDDLDEIDKVISSPLIKESAHQDIIRFIASQVKRKIKLPQNLKEQLADELELQLKKAA